MAQDPESSDQEQANPRTDRRHALRQLLHASRFAESARFGTQPSMRNSAVAGLQAAIAAGVSLSVFQLTPWAHLMGFASLGALVALFGRFAPRPSRVGIVLECAFWQTIAVLAMSLTAWLGWSQTTKLILLALSCGFYLLICFKRKFGAPGPLIFIFAVGASMADTLTLGQVVERTLATGVSAAFAWLICMASEMLRQPPGDGRPFPRDPDLPLKPLLLMAARVAIAALIVVFLADAFGLNYPAWAAMGAVAVLQGRHLHVSMHRALQRMAGTVMGAVLAWWLLTQDPSVWVIIIALMLLQFVTEIVIGFNYGIAQVLVTPMALLMTHLGAPEIAASTLAPERMLDTLLGASVGMGIAVILSSLEDRRQLAQHHHQTPHRDQ